MVFPAKPTASQQASPTKYPMLTRCSYKVLRTHPNTLPSAPFLPAAQFKYFLTSASSFAPRSHLSMWLTNISPPHMMHSALTCEQHQTLIQTLIAACQAAHNQGDLQALQHLLSEFVNLNVAPTTTTPLHLAAPTPEPRHTSPS